MRPLLLLLLLGSAATAGAQEITFASKQYEFVRDPKNNIEYPVVINRDGAGDGDIRVEVQNANEAYTFAPAALNFTKGEKKKEIFFKVNAGRNSGSDTLTGKLYIYQGGKVVADAAIRVVNKAEEKGSEPFFNRLTLLNAYQFEFYGELKSNYVGLLNLYEPARKGGWGHWGFNSGIMKISYPSGDRDSLSGDRVDYVQKHPLDAPAVGDSIVRQYNRYTTKVANSSWSFYFQPMCQVNPGGAQQTKTRIYAHGHLELLVSRLTYTTSVQALQTDSFYKLVTDPKVMPIRPTSVPGEYTTQKTYMSGYFGAGITAEVQLTDKSCFFIQGTMGLTSSSINHSSVTDYTGRVLEPHDWNGFYLVRAFFSQRLSEAAQVVVAQDIRGMLPRYNPVYATYVGVNLRLDVVFETILGAK